MWLDAPHHVQVEISTTWSWTSNPNPFLQLTFHASSNDVEISAQYPRVIILMTKIDHYQGCVTKKCKFANFCFEVLRQRERENSKVKNLSRWSRIKQDGYWPWGIEPWSQRHSNRHWKLIARMGLESKSTTKWSIFRPVHDVWGLTT